MAEARPTKPTWQVYETGEVLKNQTLIDYYKLNQLDKKLSFNLLGSFSSEGKYVLSDEVKKLLVKVKKQIVEAGNGTYSAESVLKYITLNFAVKFWTADSEGIANLYFLENFDGQILKTFVAQYAGENDENFLQRVKTAFNLLNDVEEYADEISEKIDLIASNMQKKQKERAFVVEVQSQYYIMLMFETLENGGEVSKSIAASLRELFNQRKDLPNKARLYTELRLELDKLIFEAGGFNKLELELPEFAKSTQIFTQPVKDFDDISAKLDIIEQPKPKAPTSKSSGSKGASFKPPKPGKPYQWKTEKPAAKKKVAAKKDLMLESKPPKEEIVIEKIMPQPYVPPAESKDQMLGAFENLGVELEKTQEFMR